MPKTKRKWRMSLLIDRKIGKMEVFFLAHPNIRERVVRGNLADAMNKLRRTENEMRQLNVYQLEIPHHITNK